MPFRGRTTLKNERWVDWMFCTNPWNEIDTQTLSGPTAKRMINWMNMDWTHGGNLATYAKWKLNYCYFPERCFSTHRRCEICYVSLVQRGAATLREPVHLRDESHIAGFPAILPPLVGVSVVAYEWKPRKYHYKCLSLTRRRIAGLRYFTSPHPHAHHPCCSLVCH